MSPEAGTGDDHDVGLVGQAIQARQGVYSTIRRPRVELLETGQGSPFWSALYAFKARAQATIAQIQSEPYAALLTGILLGVETRIPRGWYSTQNTIPVGT